jgi:hypothetical protein
MKVTEGKTSDVTHNEKRRIEDPWTEAQKFVKFVVEGER